MQRRIVSISRVTKGLDKPGGNTIQGEAICPCPFPNQVPMVPASSCVSTQFSAPHLSVNLQMSDPGRTVQLSELLKKSEEKENYSFTSSIVAVAAFFFTLSIPFMQADLELYASPTAIISPFEALSLKRYLPALSL